MFFRLLFEMINFIFPADWFLCCQVEEEASDKDNKNCSNNGKQQTYFFVLNTKQ